MGHRRQLQAQERVASRHGARCSPVDTCRCALIDTCRPHLPPAAFSSTVSLPFAPPVIKEPNPTSIRWHASQCSRLALSSRKQHAAPPPPHSPLLPPSPHPLRLVSPSAVSLQLQQGFSTGITAVRGRACRNRPARSPRWRLQPPPSCPTSNWPSPSSGTSIPRGGE